MAEELVETMANSEHSCHLHPEAICLGCRDDEEDIGRITPLLAANDRTQAEEIARLREALKDIDRHATPYGETAYLVTVGSLHRGLALIGGQAKCADLPCPRAEQAEAKLEEAQNIGATLMLDQMEKAISGGGKFSDERANAFVEARVKLAEAERTIAAQKVQLGAWVASTEDAQKRCDEARKLCQRLLDALCQTPVGFAQDLIDEGGRISKDWPK